MILESRCVVLKSRERGGSLERNSIKEFIMIFFKVMWIFEICVTWSSVLNLCQAFVYVARYTKTCDRHHCNFVTTDADLRNLVLITGRKVKSDNLVKNLEGWFRRYSRSFGMSWNKLLNAQQSSDSASWQRTCWVSWDRSISKMWYKK